MRHVKFLPTLPSLLVERDKPFIHRDLSWLQFNERVLAEARLSSLPLLERVKFLAITSSNLDEFFMIRFPSFLRAKRTFGDTTRRTTQLRQMLKIRSTLLENVTKFIDQQLETLEVLTQELTHHNIHIVRHPQQGSVSYDIGRKIFYEKIVPHLGAPEQFSVTLLTTLENLQLGVLLPQQMWLRLPKSIPGIFIEEDTTSSSIYCYFLDDLILTFLAESLNLKGEIGLFKVTRDGDVSVVLTEEDSESIPDIVRGGVLRRDQARASRLQFGGAISDAILDQAITVLNLKEDQILPTPGTFYLHALWALLRHPSAILNTQKLQYAPLVPVLPQPFQQLHTIFEALKNRDYLLHHPYDAFEGFVSWMRAAVADPDVVMIEQTVYRIDATSSILELLKEAAKTKKVRVCIELRARFDELNNLQLADELRKVGAEVIFGFGKLKLHAKVALITRKEGTEYRRYTHLSTGNYNASTARMYTDMSILTADASIGDDARKFFDAIARGEVPKDLKTLVVAPTGLHRIMLQHIDTEVAAARDGKAARIVAKVNALVDEQLIEKLYDASCAGVQIDLIVRGACSLIPGVKGLSENIRVVSIVDRYLEHSRIYYFGSTKQLYLSSADWMPRNFFSRLEIAFPVKDQRVFEFIEQTVLPAYLNDTTKAQVLTNTGSWKKKNTRSKNQAIHAQLYFETLSKGEYVGTPLMADKDS
jgi:polyphosphate kinase